MTTNDDIEGWGLKTIYSMVTIVKTRNIANIVLLKYITSYLCSQHQAQIDRKPIATKKIHPPVIRLTSFIYSFSKQRQP